MGSEPIDQIGWPGEAQQRPPEVGQLLRREATDARRRFLRERAALLLQLLQDERLLPLLETLLDPLLETALDWSKKLASGGPRALATTKELLRKCSVHAIPIGDLAKASAEPRLTEECHGGLKAFFENRTPPWV